MPTLTAHGRRFHFTYLLLALHVTLVNVLGVTDWSTSDRAIVTFDHMLDAVQVNRPVTIEFQHGDYNNTPRTVYQKLQCILEEVWQISEARNRDTDVESLQNILQQWHLNTVAVPGPPPKNKRRSHRTSYISSAKEDARVSSDYIIDRRTVISYVTITQVSGKFQYKMYRTRIRHLNLQTHYGATNHQLQPHLSIKDTSSFPNRSKQTHLRNTLRDISTSSLLTQED